MIFIGGPCQSAVDVVTKLRVGLILIVRDLGYLSAHVVLERRRIPAGVDYLPKPVHLRTARVIEIAGRMLLRVRVARRGRWPGKIHQAPSIVAEVLHPAGGHYVGFD